MADQTLLSYALGPSPDPLEAGSSGQLTLAVSNTGNVRVTLTQIAITLPLGQNAADLAPTSDGIGTTVPSGWSANHNSGSGTFTFTPPGGSITVGGTGYALTLTSIDVSSQPGPTRDIQVVETASTNTQPSAPRIWATPVAKFPQGFSLSDLTADPVQVNAGGNTTLMWTATAGSYTLQRDDQPDTPPWPVGLSGPQVEENLDTPPDVTFTLVGTVSTDLEGETLADPLDVQRQVTVGVKAAAPAIELFTATVQGTVRAPQIKVTWNVANVTTCQIPAISSSLFSNQGSTIFNPTPANPLPTALTLEASNTSGQVSQTLHATWGQTASAASNMPDWMAISPDGTRLYVSLDGPSTIAVLDAFALDEICPEVSPGYYPDNVVASPDGTRLYVTDGGALHAMDTTVLPPVPFGAGAGVGAEPFSLPVTPDGSLVLVGNTDNISVTPIRTSSDRNTPLVAEPWISFGGGQMFTVALSVDGQHLYGLNGSAQTLGMLDVATLQMVAGTPVGIAAAADRMAPTAPDGSILVYSSGLAGGDGGVSKLAPAPPFALEAAWDAGDSINAVIPSADGQSVFAVPGSGIFTVLTLDTLTQVSTGPAVGTVWSLAQSPDGTRIYSTNIHTSVVALITPTGYV